VPGLDVVIGYLAGWVWRRARRLAGRVESRVDEAVDARLEKVYDLVAGKLGADPALGRLESEASADLDSPAAVSDRTRQRVVLALEDALESDPAFANRLEELVSRLAGSGAAVSASGHGVAAGGSVSIHAEGGSVAAGTVDGSVTLGPRVPGTERR
jgi:hypothetical protein